MPRLPQTAAVRSPSVAWLGGTSSPELSWARMEVGRRAHVRDFAEPPLPSSVGAFDDETWPTLVLLASDVPSRWSLDDAVRITRRWPLAPVVSVASSLVEGRRRSGPPLPGIEEVPWTDLPSRLVGWLAALAQGRPGTLGLPATARREDRVLEAAAWLRRNPAPHDPAPTVSVAAARPADCESLGDLLSAAGYAVARRSCGRPPLDEPADLLVWDVECCSDDDLAWLRMLAANRPRLAVALVTSFPRLEFVQAAVAAGAGAVLGRPLALESLAGTLAAGGR